MLIDGLLAAAALAGSVGRGRQLLGGAAALAGSMDTAPPRWRCPSVTMIRLLSRAQVSVLNVLLKNGQGQTLYEEAQVGRWPSFGCLLPC